MKLTSPVFDNNQPIPSKYTCDGENVSPPFTITETPGRTQTFALIVDDPDAPNGDWIHWVVWNIPPHTLEIKENQLPNGAQEGMTDFGRPGYGGPCPPSGVHHYGFKLYALDTTLNLDVNATKQNLEAAMANHILDHTVLTGTYTRQK